MTIFERYIAKTLVLTTSISLLMLLGLEMIFALVNELRYVGVGDYQLLEAFFYLILTIPQRIYQMFPVSALIGSLMGLGLLAGQSELVAFRALGLSITQISKYVLRTGLWMAVIVWVLGEVIAPYTDSVAQNQKAFAISGGQALKTPYGMWMRDQGTFVHIQSMKVTGELENVTRYEFDDNFSLIRASKAKEAVYKDNVWHLKQISQTQFFPNKTQSYDRNEEIWESAITPEFLKRVGAKNLDEQSLYGLWESIEYRKQNNLSSNEYTYAFWKKLIQPIASMIMIFLSIPFIFGPLRSSTMGFKLFIGLIVGFSFFTLNEAFGPMSLVYNLPPFLGATLPVLFFAFFALYMLKKVR